MAIALTGCGSEAVIDLPTVESAITDWAGDLGLSDVSVDCGDRTVPAEAGYQFVCDLTDETGTVGVRVSVLNDNGDIEWELVG